jgi:hypothetical protein
MAYDKKALFAGFVGSLVPRGTCLYHFVYGPVLAQSHLTPRAQGNSRTSLLQLFPRRLLFLLQSN